ncbi:hypothetical protein F3H50_16905 [Escherichia coli]|nr:hypothetical protein [Escherichia coli]EFA4556230.1 hypothetical protein [Escherichia coli]EFA6287499.1 hypothetical protein [Escherichia coli]EFB1674153.1 hypothetical protein [Escherichia coli]EFB9251083.1 hypothetical protein [Escherichia coli]
MTIQIHSAAAVQEWAVVSSHNKSGKGSCPLTFSPPVNESALARRTNRKTLNIFTFSQNPCGTYNFSALIFFVVT